MDVSRVSEDPYLASLVVELKEKAGQESLLIGELSRLEIEDKRAVIDSPEFFNYKRRRDLLQSQIQQVQHSIEYLRGEIKSHNHLLFSEYSEVYSDTPVDDSNLVELAQISAEEANKQREHEKELAEIELQKTLANLEIAKAQAKAAQAAAGNLDHIINGLKDDG